MIFITGPLFSGKRAYARTFCSEGEMCPDAQELAFGEADLPALADRLAEQYKVVISTETGGGVVPADAALRADREAAGRLACLLAERADTVIRVFCGLPMVLKGRLPEDLPVGSRSGTENM